MVQAHIPEGRGHSPVTIFTVIIVWYFFNISLLLLNKVLLAGGSGFRGACFLSLCHMLACVVLGGIVSLSGFMPLKPLRNKAQALKIFVLSIIFCATIALGNASLKYIPVSFNQAIGATTPFFTAVFALMCQGTKEAPLTYATLVPIVLGIVIASGGEPLFHLMGFLFCVSATGGRALKTVVQSILMTDSADKLDPMSLLMYMSMCCCCLLLPATFVFEPHTFGHAYELCLNRPGFGWWLLTNSVLAYFVNLFNFLVTKLTSPLTLQVVGNLKGVVAAVISVMVFENPVTVTGALGYLITVTGVFLYSECKRRFKLAAQAAMERAGIPQPTLHPGEVSPLLGTRNTGITPKSTGPQDLSFRSATPQDGSHKV